jgi:hypothetical protein
MASTLLIIRNHAARSTLAARVVVDDEGKTWFLPGDDYFDQVMEMIGKGAYSPSRQMQTRPEDGLDFLDAVQDMFARSSAWSTRQV